jgi:hypothetical protein
MAEPPKEPTVLVDFENPPVTEVFCSVIFKPLAFMTPHIGLLWEKYKPDFPEFKDFPPGEGWDTPQEIGKVFPDAIFVIG